MLGAALRWRYLTAAVGVVIVTVSLTLSGWPAFRFVPSLATEDVGRDHCRGGREVRGGGAHVRQRQLKATGQDHFVTFAVVVARGARGTSLPPRISASRSRFGGGCARSFDVEQAQRGALVEPDRYSPAGAWAVPPTTGASPGRTLEAECPTARGSLAP